MPRINYLTKKDFAFIPTANIPLNILSEAANFRVPEGKRILLLNQAAIFRLAAMHTVTVATGTGVTTQTITLPHPIGDSADLPDVRGDVIVFLRVVPAAPAVPGPFTEHMTFTVTRPATVTITGLLAATNYEYRIFYTAAAAIYSWQVETPTPEFTEVIASGNALELTARRQLMANSMLVISRDEPIDEYMFLKLYINAAFHISFLPEARNTEIRLPYILLDKVEAE